MVFHYFFMIISSSILVGITTDNIKPCLPSSYHLVQLSAFLLCLILDIISVPVVDHLHPWCGCYFFWVGLNQILVSQNTLVLNAVNQFVMEDLQHMTIVMSGTTKVVFKIYSIVHNGYTENNKLEWEWCNCAIKTLVFHCLRLLLVRSLVTVQRVHL